MKLNVNPNRMQLLRLKKRLSFAYRGHKLLKDKQEELMRYFMKLTRETGGLRREVEEKFTSVYRYYLGALMRENKESVEAAVTSFPEVKLSVDVVNKMNLRLPVFRSEKAGFDYIPYADVNLNLALDAFSGLFPMLLELSGKEKALELTAFELQRTRRRVNALEYVLIPSLKETIKFIGDRLNELERENITRLMKIKEIVTAAV